MRVSLATFIIIIFTILAILLVKFRPTTIQYISLEQYYQIVKYCTSWNGIKKSEFIECLKNITNTTLINYNYISNVIINSTTLNEYTTFQSFISYLATYNSNLSQEITDVVTYICHINVNQLSPNQFLNITYYNYTVPLILSGSPHLSYAAYLVLIRCSSRSFILLSDSVPLNLTIEALDMANKEIYCNYMYIVNSTSQFSLSYVRISCPRAVSYIRVTDERGITVSWKTS